MLFAKEDTSARLQAPWKQDTSTKLQAPWKSTHKDAHMMHNNAINNLCAKLKTLSVKISKLDSDCSNAAKNLDDAVEGVHHTFR